MLRLPIIASLVLMACASTSPRSGEEGFQPERRFEIDSGEFVELNFEVPASTIVAGQMITPIEVVFEASGPLDWDIHAHHGAEVEVFAEGQDTSGIIRHTPGQPGMVSVLFENKSGEVVGATIRLDGKPDGAVASWYAP